MISSYIENHFSKYKKRGLTYRVPCVYHNEKEPSFDIVLDPNSKFYGMCRCWGCKKTITIKRFFEDMGWNTDFLPPELLSKRYKYKTVLSSEKHFNNIQVTQKLKNNKLPKDFKVFYTNSNDNEEIVLLNYLKRRGFDKKTIEDFSIGYIPYNDSKFAMSIIIPFYNETMNPCYFIARKIYGDMRYINLKNKDGFIGRQNVVFNYFGLQLSEKVILCEGAFNAMVWNQVLRDYPEVQAIATNGSEASEYQIELLMNRCPKEIIFAYDYRTEKQTDKLYSMLLGVSKLTHIKFNSNEDANDILIKHGSEVLKGMFLKRSEYCLKRIF